MNNRSDSRIESLSLKIASKYIVVNNEFRWRRN